MPELSAMLLAAGRGERLRPLTDRCPKPLLEVGGRPLIEHALDRLSLAGVTRCVVNISWLGDQIRSHLRQHWRWEMEVLLSDETAGRLETAGGIRKALPQLGSGPFLLANADVWCDCPLQPLAALAAAWPEGRDGHLLMVDNPAHNPSGDFGLDAAGRLSCSAPKLTYAGIAVLHPRLFAACPSGPYPLLPLLQRGIERQTLSGQHYRGRWTDVGSPERLARLRAALS